MLAYQSELTALRLTRRQANLRPAAAYPRNRSRVNSAVTLVFGVATATVPYSGQRRFHVSTSDSPSAVSTPHI